MNFNEEFTGVRSPELHNETFESKPETLDASFLEKSTNESQLPGHDEIVVKIGLIGDAQVCIKELFVLLQRIDFSQGWQNGFDGEVCRK